MTREIDYINARIRGSSGHLLSEDKIMSLLGAEDRESWSAQLRGTPYSPHLGLVAGDLDSRLFFRAVDHSVAQRTRQLIRHAQGRPGKALSICLADWDLSNLLSIFSGIHHSSKPVQIVQATLAGGLLEADQLEALSHCRTWVQAGDMLRLWRFPFSSLVRDVLARNRGLSLPQLRLDLSRSWFEALPREAKQTKFKTLSNFVSDRIDQINIMTALMGRVLPSDRDPLEFYLHGGTAVKHDTFQKILVAPNVLEALSALKAGKTRDLLMTRASGMNGGERVSVLDQVLENEIFQRYSRPLNSDPLGIEPMISFLLRLRREGTRLKLSLLRLNYNIPGDILMEMTGYV